MSVCQAICSLALLIVITIGAPCASAADEAGKTPIHRHAAELPATGEAQPAGSTGTTLVLLGVLLAGAIIARRLVQKRIEQRTGPAAHNPVRLVSRQQIDHELTVRLLQVGSRLLIVGTTPQGVATLAELDDPEEVASLLGQADNTARPASLFAGNTPINGQPDPRSTPPAAEQSGGRSRLPDAVRVGG